MTASLALGHLLLEKCLQVLRGIGSDAISRAKRAFRLFDFGSKIIPKSRADIDTDRLSLPKRAIGAHPQKAPIQIGGVTNRYMDESSPAPSVLLRQVGKQKYSP